MIPLLQGASTSGILDVQVVWPGARTAIVVRHNSLIDIFLLPASAAATATDAPCSLLLKECWAFTKFLAEGEGKNLTA